MSANGVDEVDIYSDLPNFQYDESINKLEESNKKLENQIKVLEKRLEELSKRNEKLESENRILGSNISSLYKTASNEIQRKERMIADLRRERDSFIFRRNRNQNTLKVKSCRVQSKEDYQNEYSVLQQSVQQNELYGSGKCETENVYNNWQIEVQNAGCNANALEAVLDNNVQTIFSIRQKEKLTSEVVKSPPDISLELLNPQIPIQEERTMGAANNSTSAHSKHGPVECSEQSSDATHYHSYIRIERENEIPKSTCTNSDQHSLHDFVRRPTSTNATFVSSLKSRYSRSHHDRCKSRTPLRALKDSSKPNVSSKSSSLESHYRNKSTTPVRSVKAAKFDRYKSRTPVRSLAAGDARTIRLHKAKHKIEMTDEQTEEQNSSNLYSSKPAADRYAGSINKSIAPRFVDVKKKEAQEKRTKSPTVQVAKSSNSENDSQIKSDVSGSKDEIQEMEASKTQKVSGQCSEFVNNESLSLKASALSAITQQSKTLSNSLITPEQSPKQSIGNLSSNTSSPTFSDPATFKEGKVSFCFFNEQCEFKRTLKRHSVKVKLGNITTISKEATQSPSHSSSIQKSGVKRSLEDSTPQNTREPASKKFKETPKNECNEGDLSLVREQPDTETQNTKKEFQSEIQTQANEKELQSEIQIQTNKELQSSECVGQENIPSCEISDSKCNTVRGDVTGSVSKVSKIYCESYSGLEEGEICDDENDNHDSSIKKRESSKDRKCKGVMKSYETSSRRGSRLRENETSKLQGSTRQHDGLKEPSRSTGMWRKQGRTHSGGKSCSWDSTPALRRLTGSCERRSPSELLHRDRKLIRTHQQVSRHELQKGKIMHSRTHKSDDKIFSDSTTDKKKRIVECERDRKVNETKIESEPKQKVHKDLHEKKLQNSESLMKKPKEKTMQEEMHDKERKSDKRKENSYISKTENLEKVCDSKDKACDKSLLARNEQRRIPTTEKNNEIKYDGLKRFSQLKENGDNNINCPETSVPSPNVNNLLMSGTASQSPLLQAVDTTPKSDDNKNSTARNSSGNDHCAAVNETLSNCSGKELNPALSVKETSSEGDINPLSQDQHQNTESRSISQNVSKLTPSQDMVTTNPVLDKTSHKKITIKKRWSRRCMLGDSATNILASIKSNAPSHPTENRNTEVEVSHTANTSKIHCAVESNIKESVNASSGERENVNCQNTLDNKFVPKNKTIEVSEINAKSVLPKFRIIHGTNISPTVTAEKANPLNGNSELSKCNGKDSTLNEKQFGTNSVSSTVCSASERLASTPKHFRRRSANTFEFYGQEKGHTSDENDSNKISVNSSAPECDSDTAYNPKRGQVVRRRGRRK